jgi:hypothetical protein
MGNFADHPLIAVTVKRIAFHPEQGTFGVLLLNDVPMCVTLELPWRENLPRISCIPAGQYWCKTLQSPKFGRTFVVCDVPRRSAVEFHGANTVNDLEGCIGLAEFFTHFGTHLAIANPVKGMAFKEFQEATKAVDEFLLTVQECK